jgi:hypothetical protein
MAQLIDVTFKSLTLFSEGGPYSLVHVTLNLLLRSNSVCTALPSIAAVTGHNSKSWLRKRELWKCGS